MPVRFAPPWLRSLGSDTSPLVDDGKVQDQIIKLKLEFERQDRRANGEMFVDPMIEPKTNTPPTLPFGDLNYQSPDKPKDRFEEPLQPQPKTTDVPASPLTMPSLGGGPMPAPVERPFIAPPSAPPPPPADRPPGMFRFDPRDPEKLGPEQVVLAP